jgi:hypothetical protein
MFIKVIRNELELKSLSRKKTTHNNKKKIEMPSKAQKLKKYTPFWFVENGWKNMKNYFPYILCEINTFWYK